jgi:hypothetical protein
LLIE